MAVKSSDLSNPERGLSVETRESGDSSELASLRERIKAARALKPDNPRELAQFSTLDCFQKGRDAAIRAIEGE